MRGPLAGLVLTALLVPGCAAHAPAPMRPPGAVLLAHPRVVVLPLANLSGRLGQAEVMSRIVFSQLAAGGAMELVDYGAAESAIEEMRLRDTGSLTREQLRGLGERTGATYAFLGSVLEAETVNTPEGQVPTVGIALRMVEIESARVVWAASRFLSGQDRETVFGWGRETSINRVAEKVVAEMLAGFRGRAKEPPPNP
jgi:TolB-like protein